MKPLNKITAKRSVLLLLVIVVTALTDKTNAQTQYTTILKNFNPEAQNLYHELSPQGDSLYLRAESIFYKVSFLNSMDRKVYRFNPPVLEAAIPLHDIIVGDYTVLVYKKDRIIVFHIKRLLEIEKVLDSPYTETIPSDEILITEAIPLAAPSIEMIQGEMKANNFIEFTIATEQALLQADYSEIVGASTQNILKPYNLSSTNRDGMQSREAYRRNNLRPNGKPFDWYCILIKHLVFRWL